MSLSCSPDSTHLHAHGRAHSLNTTCSAAQKLVCNIIWPIDDKKQEHLDWTFGPALGKNRTCRGKYSLSITPDIWQEACNVKGGLGHLHQVHAGQPELWLSCWHLLLVLQTHIQQLHHMHALPSHQILAPNVALKVQWEGYIWQQTQPHGFLQESCHCPEATTFCAA